MFASKLSLAALPPLALLTIGMTVAEIEAAAAAPAGGEAKTEQAQEKPQ